MKKHPVQCMFGIRQPNEEQKKSLSEAKPAAEYAVEADIDMDNLVTDTKAGLKKNLVSMTKKLDEVNRKMHKNILSGNKDFNKKTPEFQKALEKAQ